MRRRQRSTAAILAGWSFVVASETLNKQIIGEETGNTSLETFVVTLLLFVGALCIAVNFDMHTETENPCHPSRTLTQLFAVHCHTFGNHHPKSFNQQIILPTSIYVRIHFVRLRKYVLKKTP